MAKSKVKNLSSHVVYVEPDGKMIEPGEILSGVDMDSDHNKSLVDSEHLIVVEKETTDKEKEGNK